MSAEEKHNLPANLADAVVIARRLIQIRDPYTASHENHVGELAKSIAKKMGLGSECQEALLLAGYLHDIGKIVVPVSILTKPGKISPEEYHLIQNHVQAGFDILSEIHFPKNVSRAVLEHHERMDGSGYPNHLHANQISLEGRILAVADVVVSMAGSRPYRSALGVEAAVAEIKRGRGSIYDESAVDSCIFLICNEGYEVPGA